MRFFARGEQMPNQTKAQLLNQVEVLKYQNAGQLEQISAVRKSNAELSFRVIEQEGRADRLSRKLENTRAQFEAYKSGARTFQQLAEGEIMEQAKVNATQKISLLNSLT